ncbi:hypothetical protein BDZ91DRAFT_791854 [Kalaharituber pfeilii]|nr:hypothetical protein BDZ91DRAFT_791854 [Kalaharituber pfeilii]
MAHEGIKVVNVMIVNESTRQITVDDGMGRTFRIEPKSNKSNYTGQLKYVTFADYDTRAYYGSQRYQVSCESQELSHGNIMIDLKEPMNGDQLEPYGWFIAHEPLKTQHNLTLVLKAV